jgi:hypothetical protein
LIELDCALLHGSSAAVIPGRLGLHQEFGALLARQLLAHN